MSNQKVSGSRSFGWRPFEWTDAVRGTCVRIKSMNDTPYNGATVMGIEKDLNGRIPAIINDRVITLARPQAYAAEHWDSKQPMLYAEVYSMSIKSACECLEVYETSTKEVRKLTT